MAYTVNHNKMMTHYEHQPRHKFSVKEKAATGFALLGVLSCLIPSLACAYFSRFSNPINIGNQDTIAGAWFRSSNESDELAYFSGIHAFGQFFNSTIETGKYEESHASFASLNATKNHVVDIYVNPKRAYLEVITTLDIGTPNMRSWKITADENGVQLDHLP